LTMSDMTTEWIAEDELARQLNVERGILKKMRPSLPAGSLTSEGRRVMWSQEAASVAATTVGLSYGLHEKNAATEPASAREVEVLTVVRNFPNPRVIQARRASGEVVTVRVSNGLKYLPKLRDGKPMTLRAYYSPADNCWVREGRDPRFVGVW